MVKSLVNPLRRWPALDTWVAKLLGHFTTWPADEFQRFIRARSATPATEGSVALPPATEPVRSPAPVAIAPDTFEKRFMRLHAEDRFDEMWDLLAEDAQRAWGGRDAFVKGMPRMGAGTEVLEMQVLSVAVLPSWADRRNRRTYSNVAQMVMRYRVRQQWREWTFDRQVHLIPAAGGWRTLCYPAAPAA